MYGVEVFICSVTASPTDLSPSAGVMIDCLLALQPGPFVATGSGQFYYRAPS